MSPDTRHLSEDSTFIITGANMRTRFLTARGRIARAVYRHRHVFGRLVFIRRPVLVRLAEFQMYVQLNDMAVGFWIALGRIYEPHVSRVIRSHLEPGMVFIDIGANIGYYTLLAAQCVSPQGKVIAFEPNDANCALLRMSIEVNSLDNVELHSCAVSDAQGVVGFETAFGNSWMSRDLPATCAYTAHTIILDEYLKDEPRIDVVKMDIEGAEWKALRGMGKLIHRHRPLIFCEFHPSALEEVSGISPELYLNLLCDLGYELLVMRADNPIPVPQSSEQIMNYFVGANGTHLDLMARPKTRD